MRSMCWTTIAPLLLVSGLFVGMACVTGARAVSPAGPPDEHPEVDFSISCEACHEEETPEIVAAWQRGAHGMGNVGCFICHGDGEIEFYEAPSTDICLTCHDARMVDFEAVGVESCFTCHDGHDLTFHEN